MCVYIHTELGSSGLRVVPGLQRGPELGSVGRRLSISLGKHTTVFQAKAYVILGCVHETETQIGQRIMLVFALIAKHL